MHNTALTHWGLVMHLCHLTGSSLVQLTHWPLGDLDAISKLQMSMSFYWLVSSHLQDNALRWMPRDFTDDKSILVQVMAWCHQSTSHYLSQCWFRSLSPYGITRPQWVDGLSPFQSAVIYIYAYIDLSHWIFSLYQWFLVFSLVTLKTLVS